jgi:hypothetical protein
VTHQRQQLDDLAASLTTNLLEHIEPALKPSLLECPSVPLLRMQAPPADYLLTSGSFTC